MEQQQGWASLPAEVWRRVAAAAAAQLIAPGLQHDTLGVLSFQLLARLSCVSTSLRKAFSTVAWNMFPFQSTYIGLSEQASGKLNRWRAARLPHDKSAILHGARWDIAVLRDVMASVGQLRSSLKLLHMYVASEAACCNAELSKSALTGLVYQDLRALPVLKLLLLVSYGHTLAEQDVQRLATCLPALTELHLHIVLSPFAGFSCSLKPLASLLPGVGLSLTVLLFPSELRSLAQQLQGIKLGAVDLRCLRDGFSEEAEALLAQCSMARLTVHFADSGTRLRRVPPLPPGARVRYCKIDPAIAAAALSVSFTLDDLFSSSEEDD